MPENINPQDVNKPLKVNHWLMYFSCIFIVAFFLFIAIIGRNELDWYYQVFDIFMIGFGMLAFARIGSTEMNNELIFRNSILGKSKIMWDDVQRIINIKRYFYFQVEKKLILIPGKFFWSGKEKKQMWALMKDQIESREIPVLNMLGKRINL